FEVERRTGPAKARELGLPEGFTRKVEIDRRKCDDRARLQSILGGKRELLVERVRHLAAVGAVETEAKLVHYSGTEDLSVAEDGVARVEHVGLRAEDVGALVGLRLVRHRKP